jgi:uncharacterized protein YpmS
MKWIKRFVIFLLVLVVGGAAFFATTYWLSKRKPSWYKPLALNSREMEAAANRALNKMIAVHNAANESAANDASRQWRQEHGAATKPAVPPLTVTFTQDELTAFIDHWSKLNSEKTDKYITGPQFVLEDGQIKFACHITEFDQIGVVRVEPTIDEKGLLHLEIVSLSAGSLPVPEAMVQKRLVNAEAMLRQWLPSWQQSARINPDGANIDAEKAAMTKLLLNTLHHQPAAALLFMPTLEGQKKPVPMKLTNVAVGQGVLTLTVEPLSEEDRKAALEAIRAPIKMATAQSD